MMDIQHSVRDTATITELLSIEHHNVATQLGLIDRKPLKIQTTLLYRSMELIDRASRLDEESSRNIVILLSAIVWTYRDPEWDGLKDFLILVMSRVGFAPSSIMVDEEFDRETKQYSPTPSLLGEMAVALHQLKYEVTLCDSIYLLTRFQKTIWEKIEQNAVLGISAPTSAGKSFIIALKSIDLLLKEDGTIIYIVPTLSLVTQVSLDYHKLLKSYCLDDYEILNTYIGEYTDSKKVFVLTQEKAIGAFSQSETPFKNVRLLVVDEIQNLERVGGDEEQRAKVLYDLLIEFRHSTQPDHTIISGPRIEKIGNLGVEVFGENTDEEESKSSPVASITYAITKTGKDYYFTQYTSIGNPRNVLVKNFQKIVGTGGVQYRQNFHNFLINVIKGLGNDSKNIVFSPTSGQARRTATAIADAFHASSHHMIESLVKYLSDTVHNKYALCDCLKKGVAYHHGRLPHHVRRVLEKAISEKVVDNVVCTTTLMQGVNLPAQNIIIRNPNLFVTTKHGQPMLTDYEIANLRGRAGRLLKDFMGRTFVLDGTAFSKKDEEQQSLFEEATKEIHPGYKEMYERYEFQIGNGLLTNEVPTLDNKEYSFLLTYIRQSILRHKDGAIDRFRSVGISLDSKTFADVKQELSRLVVPERICLQNRYWDPIDINKLYLNRGRYKLPASVYESGITAALMQTVSRLKADHHIYYQRYFNLPEAIPGMLYSACIYAEKWLKETPLKDILSDKYHDDSEKIENTISLLQNRISFGLPMLLKPIYDINLPENPFLRYLELGAFMPTTRRLIEYNIPRETSIRLVQTILKSLTPDQDNFDRAIKRSILMNWDKMDHWTRVQLEVVV